jgi:hypothetical protein
MALTGTHFGPAASSPLAIAAVEPSPSSEHGSEISIPTRGWASAAGSVQEDPVCALYERNLNCHLCFTPGHFLMDCPFLGAETKQAAQKHREARLRDTPAVRAILPGNQMAPPLRPLRGQVVLPGGGIFAVPLSRFIRSSIPRMNLSRLWRKRRNSGRKTKRGTRRDARPPISCEGRETSKHSGPPASPFYDKSWGRPYGIGVSSRHSQL